MDNNSKQQKESIDLQKYLRRLDYSKNVKPTYKYVKTIMQRHMATIPFENIDVMLGREIDISAQAIDNKILDNQRGGYCFEHASLMRRALQAIGLEVSEHLARVCIGENGDKKHAATHASLKVKIEGKLYLVDVGFGSNMPNQPLLFEIGNNQETSWGTYRLRKTCDGFLLESFHKNHWIALYEILDFNWQKIDYKVANYYVSTNENSHFKKKLTIALTAPNKRKTISNNRFKITNLEGKTQEKTLNATEIEKVLDKEFGLCAYDSWKPLLEHIAGS